MSEVSESYHLKTNEIMDGIKLLQEMGVSGFVFPSENDWVTIVAKGEVFTKNHDLIRASSGVMVYYSMVGDFGCEVVFYLNGEKITQYQCAWADDVHVVNTLNKDLLVSRLGLSIESGNPDIFKVVLAPMSMESIWENNPAAFIADAIGLMNYEWISFESMLIDQEEGVFNYPGVIFVE